MTDSYQAIYDAVRSRISNGDIGHAVREAALRCFDISHVTVRLQGQMYVTAGEMQRPAVLFRPRLFMDGDMWCALYGENLQDGVSGFGKSPDAATYDFDKNWRIEITRREASHG